MTELETAAHPQGLRRVAIDPLSRVEGHGKVTLLLDEHNRVQQARLHIVEFRGFEAFICGRPYWEVPVMVQRLCGICPVSHHLAASKAIDHALGVQAPPAALALRRLMHHGQILQSHALHFFHLSSPDLLFGFASEVGRRNIVGVAAAHPEVARQGVLLRKFGQQVIEATAGKRVHGTGSVPGGVNRRPTREERAALAAQLPQVLDWCEAAVDLAQRLHDSDPVRHRGFALLQSSWMSLVDADGAMDLYDGRLRVCGADGAPQVQGHDVQDYATLIEEEVKSWSWMKFPYLRALGPDQGWYRVGPLARLQAVRRIGTPRAEARRQAFVAGGPVQGSLAYHRARMIEMLHAAEVIAALLADPRLDDEALRAEPMAAAHPGPRRGVGAIEAPRGTLIHDYTIGDDDLVTQCNLIVSTTHNNQAMNEAVRAVAREYFDGREVSEGLLNHIEVAIRAYDPCLSCATHALGCMPLEVGLQDARGHALGSAWRHGDGRFEAMAPIAAIQGIEAGVPPAAPAG
jgi:NAD-reducing hydrogenase large subunit